MELDAVRAGAWWMVRQKQLKKYTRGSYGIAPGFPMVLCNLNGRHLTAVKKTFTVCYRKLYKYV